MVDELYAALRAAGVEDRLARAAAEAVLSSVVGRELASKAELRQVREAIAKEVREQRWATSPKRPMWTTGTP